MGKNKKQKIPFGKKEMIFNCISLLAAIGVGLYFGSRSFYYYSKQNTKLKEDAFTLNGSILTNNYVVTDGDGLHRDQDGYYFKGNVINNYVVFANRTFRVVRINNDETVKLISEDIATEFMWGEEFNYLNSNLDKWLDKKEEDGTGIYYDTIPNPEEFLVKTKYTQPVFDGKKVTDGNLEVSTYITTLDIKDYSNANGKNSYLNNGKYFWLIGINKDSKNLHVTEDGSLLDGDMYENYGIRPVITLKKDTLINSGIGTKDSPYVINQGNNTNLVDTYVKIGTGMWKIFYEKDNVVKLAYLDGIGKRAYKDIANYLNGSWYNNLMYKSHMLDLNVYTGEVSADTSLNFMNIYNDKETCKVTLMNLFDYNNLDLDDYYLSNTTSSVGNMAYVYHNYGILGEANVKDSKSIIPVIALSKDDIETSVGKGTKESPFGVR